MTRQHWLPLFSAIVGVALTACGTSTPASSPEALEPATATAAVPTYSTTLTAIPSPTPQATPVVPTPAATSRGPDLEASDPAAARLDAGSLQLVEFFRFT